MLFSCNLMAMIIGVWEKLKIAVKIVNYVARQRVVPMGARPQYENSVSVWTLDTR